MNTILTATAPDFELSAQSISPADIYLSTLAPGSYRAMKRALDDVATIVSGTTRNSSTFAWGELRYHHFVAARAQLARKQAPATANRALAAVRGTLKTAWRLGQIPTEEYHRAIDQPRIKGETPPKGRALSREEMEALFLACANDTSVLGDRDAALLSILYGCGLRRFEAEALDFTDYDAFNGDLMVRTAKGNFGRIQYLAEDGQAAVKEWLRLRGEKEGPLFLALTKNGRILDRRLSDEGIAAAIEKRQIEAGLRPFSCHDLRRTFISDLLEIADLATVQRCSGHRQPSSTTRYDMRGEKAKRKASVQLRIPYISKKFCGDQKTQEIRTQVHV